MCDSLWCGKRFRFVATWSNRVQLHLFCSHELQLNLDFALHADEAIHT